MSDALSYMLNGKLSLTNIDRQKLEEIVADAQGLPADHVFDLSVLVASERGNKLELDQYEPQFGARPGPSDQLPPGVAMTTFEADSLQNLAVDFITPPAPSYEGYHAATFIGPAGERTELVARI